MSKLEALWDFLKTEYGIETPEQLEEAYKNRPKLNIAPFVSPIDPEKMGAQKEL